MGDGNRTRDPYFHPQDDGGSRGPGRASPFLDPPNFRPGGTDNGGQPSSRDLNPDDRTRRWTPPKNTPAWTDPQPGMKDKPAAQSELQRNVGSKSSQLLTAREKQTGSNLAKAMIGGTAGVLTEPVAKLGEKGATKLMSAGEGTRSYAAGDWYKRNFTKIGSNAAELAKEGDMAARAASNYQRVFNLDSSIITKLEGVKTGTPLKLAPEEAKHLEGLVKALGIKNPNALTDGTLENLLKERQALFKPIEETVAGGGKVLKPTVPVTKEGAEEILATIRGTEATKGTKLFTSAEKGYLETQQLSFERIKILEDARIKGAASGEAKWITKGGAWENAKKGFIYTLATGGVLEADHNVRDRMYGTDAKSWETSSLTVPLAIGLGSGWKGKALLAAGAVLGGHVVDNELPVPDWMPIPKAAKQFTAFDAASLAIGFGLSASAKSNWVKAGTIALSVVLGKGADSLFLGSSAGDIESRTLEDVKRDKTERSYSSMERVVKDWKELSNKNEVVVEQDLANLLIETQKSYKSMSQEEKLSSHRATIGLARAIGEHHLENGTRLSPKAVDSPMYILKDMDPPLDLGADSLFYLQMANRSVDGAKAMTKIMLDQGKQANSTKIHEQELKDLDNEKDKINADINTIYGKHDIESAFRQFKKFLKTGETSKGATLQKELAYQKTFVEELNQKIARNWSSAFNEDGSIKDPDSAKVLAKLFRDQALAKLSFAGMKLDNGDDIIGAGQTIWGTPQGRQEGLPGMTNPDGTAIPKGYDGVIDLLKMADRLDGDNKDMDQLWAITKRLADEAHDKEPSQWDKFDILNVRGK